MSNQTDIQEQTDTRPDEGEAATTTAVEQAASADEPAMVVEPQAGKDGSRAAFLLAALALLGVVALAAGAYYWFYHWRAADSQALEQRLATLEASAASAAEGGEKIESQITTLSARLEQAAAGIADLQAGYQASRQEQLDLLAAFNRLQEKQTPGRIGWKLREIEHLLIVAGQRLTLQQDVATALAALQAADARLEDLADPSWNALRRQLVAEMNALRSVDSVDNAGIALYFADMMTRVADLPLRDGKPVDAQGAASDSNEAQPGGWREKLSNLWTVLRAQVVVKDREIPEFVVFDPELRYLLQHSLRLEFANARLAALSRDDRNFKASMTGIKELLNTYFNTEAPPVADLLARLESYSSQTLNPELPDISGSLNLLRERMAASDNDGTAS
jgi:uroporphyrin-3 C-methyltransferase